ncbi:hypothetical protein MMC25_004638 [Agyrium rufum]|nr:hypothetical protein [Agyrium rufum]
MRNKPSSSMQKTYDECYLICSTAVYFEGQNNEAEALRSWRSALDQIYYHNAYRVPANYQPKSATEKALQESLREMEMQCKERVDLLEALRQSRLEAKGDDKSGKSSSSLGSRNTAAAPPAPPYGSNSTEPIGFIGDGTIPAVNYPDLSKPGPALPYRPPVPPRHASSDVNSRPTLDTSISSRSFNDKSSPNSLQPSSLPTLPKPSSRTSSPEKRNRMLTTLRAPKDGKRPVKSPKRKPSPKATTSSKAAGLAWDSISKGSGSKIGQAVASGEGNSTTSLLQPRSSMDGNNDDRRDSVTSQDHDGSINRRTNHPRPLSPLNTRTRDDMPLAKTFDGQPASRSRRGLELPTTPSYTEDLIDLTPPNPPPHTSEMKESSGPNASTTQNSRLTKPPLDFPSYRSEYPTSSLSKAQLASRASEKVNRSPEEEPALPPSIQTRNRPPIPTQPLSRRPVAKEPKVNDKPVKLRPKARLSSESGEEATTSSNQERRPAPVRRKKKVENKPEREAPPPTATPPSSDEQDVDEGSLSSTNWQERLAYIKKHLPVGVDEFAAKQIFNEIVVEGDEVHWEDVAGLETAKKALKEAVVYPFLRPDLFMGLREPARGMLLFGPPGTGKTMLARAVATESKSTFFAISASSLTSKWLGESEKLVRALFQLAKALAPSIIFVDEIDSLLSSRGGSSEHESTRRVKTEFLIQWSDLQRAAAGKDSKVEGDASRVLVLAATNLPWEIDEAARRRFVRRQYIPLPEAEVRKLQILNLLGHQKHGLSQKDLEVLVQVTDGFSGSDMTALAKDAAMGPLRSLGEALLQMSMDEIRPIKFEDFEASLMSIRPSVSKQGLQQFEDWAKEFGERGG